MPLRYSLSCTVVWKMSHNIRSQAIFEDNRRLGELFRQEAATYAYGPQHKFESEEDSYRHCAHVWSRSSELMHHLAEANGIRYYHFLQPNQYASDSKSLGASERAIAVNPEQPYRMPVVKGYPLLRAEGENLKARGVRFHDATLIFVHESEPVYVDDCCHVNERGNLLLARYIARVIREDYGAY